MATEPLSTVATPSLPKGGQIGFKEVMGVQEPYLQRKAELQTQITGAEGEEARAKQAQAETMAAGKVGAQEAFGKAEKGAMQQYQQKLEAEPLPSFIPTKDTAQDIAGLFSLIGVIGMIAGKGDAMKAMGAMNGMLEGHRKGRADLYKQQASEFDKNFKAMLSKHAEFRKEMEDAVKLATTDKEAGMQAAELAAVKSGSEIVKAQLRKGDLVGALNLVKESSQGADKALTMESQMRQKAADRAAADERARLQREQAKELAQIRASGGGKTTDRFGFGDIVATASNEAAASLKNLVQLPSEVTSGIFGGRETKSLLGAPLDALINTTVTKEDTQRYNAEINNLGKFIAQVQKGGRMVTNYDVENTSSAFKIKEGDKPLTKLTKLAQARQALDRALDVRIASPNTPEALKEVYIQNKKDIETSVPFTVSDVNNYANQKNKKATFSDMFKKYDFAEPAAPAAQPVASGIDEERTKANAAIQRDANPDAVKQRFKQTTGQEL